MGRRRGFRVLILHLAIAGFVVGILQLEILFREGVPLLPRMAFLMLLPFPPPLLVFCTFILNHVALEVS